MGCKIYVGSTNRLVVRDLVNGKDDAALTSATVTAKLMDVQRNVIATITLVYDAATTADFEGYIADTVAIIAGTQYLVEFKVDAGTNLKKTILATVTAEIDNGGCP